jgi:hypothetical protein
VRAEWPELSSLSYVGYYKVVAAGDPIGNDIGVNHDNGVKPLAEDPIDNYIGVKPLAEDPIGNDIGVNNGVNPLVIGDDYGGSDSVIKPTGSSPKPNQVNNDNVAEGTLAWPKLKPIVKVIGTSAWLKPINIANVRSTSAKHCGGGEDSANRIKIANAKSTSAKHYGGGDDSANRFNIANAKSTSAKHCGGGNSPSSVAGDNGMAHSTDADACLPFWVMKTDGRPPH